MTERHFIIGTDYKRCSLLAESMGLCPRSGVRVDDKSWYFVDDPVKLMGIEGPERRPDSPVKVHLGYEWEKVTNKNFLRSRGFNPWP